MNREGSWVAATPIPGTVLVNVGDMMQRWTDDRLISNVGESSNTVMADQWREKECDK